MRNRGHGAAGPHRPAYRAAAVHLPGVDRKGRAGTCGKYKGLRVMHHCFALQGFSSTTPCPKPLLASGCAPGIIGSDPRTQSHPPLMENNCSFIMAVNGERGNNHSEWSHLLGKSRAESPADTSVQGCAGLYEHTASAPGLGTFQPGDGRAANNESHTLVWALG